MRLPAIVLALFLGFLLFAKPASAEEKTGTAQHGQHPYNSLEQHPECDGIIAKLDKSGSATVSIGWWPAQRLFTSDAVEPVRQVCSLAELASYWPHRLGAIDLLAFAAPTLDDNPCLTDFDETLFGRDEDCSVELWDSPSLLANLELVSRLPESALRIVTVYTTRSDEPFLKAVRRIKVPHGVRLRTPADREKKSGSIFGVVVDSNGKPVNGATVIIRAPNGEIVIGSWTCCRGQFWEFNIRNVPYRIEAFAPPSRFASSDSKVASSEPVDAKPGDRNVRLVINPTRLVPQPPQFVTVEDDNGKRIELLDPPDAPKAPGTAK